MVTTASRVLWSAAGSPAVTGAVDVDGRCWVCAARMTRGLRVDKWQGSNFTGQNRVRSPASTHVCEPCVWAMAGKPPDTLRMTSHLWDEYTGWERPNKGNKPSMRAFLRREHRGEWLAAIADSGQKHIVPWTPVNPAGTRRGRVVFETEVVELPREAGWVMVDTMALLLTLGATKEEITRGEYSARAYSLLGAEAIEKFESEWARQRRGGPWFALAIWLAQRDEAAVAARLEAEKAAKAAKKLEAKNREKTRRTDEGTTADGAGRGTARRARGVPQSGSKPAEALGPVDGQDARSVASVGEPGGVVHGAVEEPRPVGSQQLGLFESQAAGGPVAGGKRGRGRARSDRA